MKVIEVNHVVVNILCAEHQVANEFCIWGYHYPQGVFHRSDGCEGMNGGTHAANPTNECPGIARVATSQNFFDKTNHRSGTVGLDNFPIIYFGFDP
jgi:hypothetical protein